MAVKKRWHITFTSTESPRPYTVSLTKKLGIALGSLAVIFLIIIAGSLIYIGYHQNKIITAQQIIKENEHLKERLSELSGEIDSILVKLRLMEEWEDEIRLEKNLKNINKEIREMGVGGLPQTDLKIAQFTSETNQFFNQTITKMENLKTKINFDYSTHSELLEQVKLKESLFRNTPSIYPTYGRISDGYGWRTHPVTKKRTYHHGLDFSNKIGTPVYATADGIVENVTTKRLIGKYIVLTHKFGYQTGYGHLHKILVKVSDVVKRGQIIALMGNSGRSTGAHLHYEVLRYKKYRNPYNYLNKLEDDIVLTSK
jgi:murein DD-endopeptidase MepM/ murein hydrolase activator NlpD